MLSDARRTALREAFMASVWDYVHQHATDLRVEELLQLLDAADQVAEAQGQLAEEDRRETRATIDALLESLDDKQLHEALGLLQGHFPKGGLRG